MELDAPELFDSSLTWSVCQPASMIDGSLGILQMVGVTISVFFLLGLVI